MKYIHLFATLLFFSCSINFGEGKRTEVFDYSQPVDLSAILQAYGWSRHYEGDDMDSILLSMIVPNLPEDEIYLFEDTTFVLRVPEYAGSQQPFLANAEDFYNSCALSWNVWSNYEVWYRGHTADLLRYDEDVWESIEAISVNMIKDANVRKAAQIFKDSLLLMMKTEPNEWDEDFNPMELLISYNDAIESVAYKFYDDEETFITSVDHVTDIAEEMAMAKFQHYLDAKEEEQAYAMLREISTCQTFDEQCSLWRNWANCEKSGIDDQWIVAVGCVLMKSGNYSPILHHIWITWRAITQSLFFGSSRDSSIPNHYFNEYRKMCYTTCLKRISCHPDDVYAMNCAAVIGGRTNLNRFGQSYFGNEAMIEKVMMLPKRYYSEDSGNTGSYGSNL